MVAHVACMLVCASLTYVTNSAFAVALIRTLRVNRMRTAKFVLGAAQTLHIPSCSAAHMISHAAELECPTSLPSPTAQLIA